MSAEVKRDAVVDGSHFVTTQWHVVLSSADEQAGRQGSQVALGRLCQTYWRPIYAVVCRSGYDEHEAEDVTQEFFVMVLNGDLLQRATPERGRFRSLLQRALTNFLRDHDRRASAEKRLRPAMIVSWDVWVAECGSHLTLPRQQAEGWSIARMFDVGWAATIVDQALRRLEAECAGRGRHRIFEALRSALLTDRAEIGYTERLAELGLTEANVRTLLRRLRQRYRALIREEVRKTVADPTEVEDEIRYLCSVLAAAST